MSPGLYSQPSVNQYTIQTQEEGLYYYDGKEYIKVRVDGNGNQYISPPKIGRTTTLYVHEDKLTINLDTKSNVKTADLYSVRRHENGKFYVGMVPLEKYLQKEPSIIEGHDNRLYFWSGTYPEFCYDVSTYLNPKDGWYTFTGFFQDQQKYKIIFRKETPNLLYTLDDNGQWYRVNIGKDGNFSIGQKAQGRKVLTKRKAQKPSKKTSQRKSDRGSNRCR